MASKTKISIIVPAHKYDNLLIQAVKSANFAKEIILLWDKKFIKNIPKQIAKNKILIHDLQQNFAKHRNFALKKAKYDWVFFLDSDELITPKLAREIKSAIKNNKYQAFYIERKDIFYNHRLKHGETGNIKIIRLMQKNSGKFIREVHELWQTKYPTGKLKNPLLHHHNNLTANFINKIIHYSPIDSQTLSKENKPFSRFRLLVYPTGKFINNFIFKLGFLDQTLGLFHAYLMSIQSLTIRIYQWQNQNIQFK